MYPKLVIVVGLITLVACQQSGHAQERKIPPQFRPIEDDPSLPRVLILGDSISIGYTLGVRERLSGEANVHRAAENCGPTTRGLARLDAWLGEKPWDVIHFNFGLHDLKFMDEKGRLVDPADGRVQVAPADYEQNLRTLIVRLKKTGAKLIWCSTTPVPDGALGRIVGDSKKYNAIASKVVEQELGDDRVVNDLYQFCLPQLAEIQQPANVHFTPAGSAALAEQVAKVIREQLVPERKQATARVQGDESGN